MFQQPDAHPILNFYREIHVLIRSERDPSVMMAAGVAIGAAGAIALTRVMAGLLYEVRPNDAATFAGAAALLALLALAASLVPAWRATRVDPLVARPTE